MKNQDNETLRHLPSVDGLLKNEALATLAEELGQDVVTKAVRQALEMVRQDLLSGQSLAKDSLVPLIVESTKQALSQFRRPFYRRVINATGVILHTALGRAVLAQEALDEIQSELAGYTRLQTDIVTGKRSSRDLGVERLLRDHQVSRISAGSGRIEANLGWNPAAPDPERILKVLERLNRVALTLEDIRSPMVETGGALLCPFCHEFISDADPLARCDVCVTPYHPSCFEENRGCAVYGCENRTVRTRSGRFPAAVRSPPGNRSGRAALMRCITTNASPVPPIRKTRSTTRFASTQRSRSQSAAACVVSNGRWFVCTASARANTDSGRPICR